MVEKFKPFSLSALVEGAPQFSQYSAAKQCALIAVDEVINSMPMNPHNHSYYEIWSDRSDEAVEYWQKVKSEINKL